MTWWIAPKQTCIFSKLNFIKENLFYQVILSLNHIKTFNLNLRFFSLWVGEGMLLGWVLLFNKLASGDVISVTRSSRFEDFQMDDPNKCVLPLYHVKR